MKNINYDEIVNAISVYNAMTDVEKKEFEPKINAAWREIFEHYCQKCSIDKKLNEMIEIMNEYNCITSFDIKEHYVKHEYVGGKYTTSFDEQAYNDAKRIYENLDFLVAKLNKEIYKTKYSKLVFAKNKKLHKLENKLKQIKIIAQKYEHFKEQENLKYQYLKDKKFDEYKLELIKLYKSNAEKTLSECLELYPYVACVKHITSLTTFNSKSYKDVELNATINQIRKKALLIKKNKQDNTLIK